MATNHPIRPAPKRFDEETKAIWDETYSVLADAYGPDAIVYWLLENFCVITRKVQVLHPTIEKAPLTLQNKRGNESANPALAMYFRLSSEQRQLSTKLGLDMALMKRLEKWKGEGDKANAGSALLAMAQEAYNNA